MFYSYFNCNLALENFQNTKKTNSYSNHSYLSDFVLPGLLHSVRDQWFINRHKRMLKVVKHPKLTAFSIFENTSAVGIAWHMHNHSLGLENEL